MKAVEPIPITKPLRHRWFERTPKPIFDPKTGCERHERICKECHMWRTTVIPPYGMVWIEWESASGEKWINGKTRPCEPIADIKAVAS